MSWLNKVPNADVIRFKFHTSGQSSYNKQSAESLFTYCNFCLFATICRLLKGFLHSMLLVLISNQRKNESTINTTKLTKCKSDYKGVSSVWHITTTAQFNTFKCILPDHSTVSLTTPGYTCFMSTTVIKRRSKWADHLTSNVCCYCCTKVCFGTDCTSIIHRIIKGGWLLSGHRGIFESDRRLGNLDRRLQNICMSHTISPLHSLFPVLIMASFFLVQYQQSIRKAFHRCKKSKVK